MGKAEIISHLGDGQYSVKLLRDQTWLDGRIVWLAGRITELQAERVPLAEALAAAIAEFEAAETVVEQLQKNIAVSIAKVDLARIDAAILSAQKRKSQLESAVSTLAADTRSVWCADLTTTLSGEYPTAEVNGTSDHAILMPGTMPTEYTGDLTPVLSMTVAQACYNFALHPGWQRWTPTFRLATITDLSVAQDTCSVALFTAKDRYQGLEINASETLDNVPISYMTCDAEAFTVGDEVLIMFQGQDWAAPAVVGFKQEPKDCEDGDCILVVSAPSGAEAFAWDALNDELLVEKADFSSVVAQVQALGFDFSPKKLEPSQTEEISHEVGGHPYYYQISGAFNQPDFFINTDALEWVHPYQGSIVYGVWPYRYTRTHMGSGIHNFTWQGSVVIDPDTEEAKGLHILDLDHNLTGDTASRQSAVNYLFDTDVGDLEYDVVVGGLGYELEYPHPATYCQAFRTWTERMFGYWYDGEEFDYATAFADYNLYRPFQDQGIASNQSYHAVFENASFCKNWRDPEETLEDFQNTFPPRLTTAADDQGVCITEGGDPAYPRGYVRNLRLFVKERTPELSALEAKALELINFERTQRNLEPFVWNHVLGASATRHSNDMADSDFVNTRPPGGTSWHIGSDDSTIADRIIGAGYFLHHNRGTYVDEESAWYNGQANENVGGVSYPLPESDEDLPENVVAATYWEVIGQDEYVAKGLAEHMVALWMASTEGHRELMIGEATNLINGIDFSECGISAVESAGTAYWTLNVGARFNTWPGYGAVATDSLCAYMDDYFTWDALNDGSRVPQMYLI